MYKVNPFLVHEIEHQNYVLQTKSSTVLITNEQLINILLQIEREQIGQISKEWIENNIINISSEKVIDFLINNNIITIINNIDYKFMKIICCSNNISFTKLFYSIFESKYEIIAISLDEIYNYKFCESDFCIIFLDPFIYSDFICLDKHIKEKNIITKFIFYYNYSLYITNFYKYDWHTPCPKCFLSNLESHLRGSQFTEGLNFQLLIDLIYKKSLKFPVSAEISSYDLVSLMFFLKKQISDFESNKNYVINELCEISLENNQTVKDSSVYWEMCDCYE